MPPSASTFYLPLRNGDQVKVNDHVYCSPSFAVRDGTPYSVARIMEFLPAQGTPTFDKGGKRNEPFTRVRVAWYYRPSDVSDRPVADSRLLLAAIYSEVCDINQLRAKCHVIHRDKITDLAGWKKRPDRFYFQRLFDPWIRKEFEVISATTVRNLPANIRDVLISRYEYVVAEKEVVPDLTDTLRHCDTCEQWCSPPETVQCDRCKKFFHMGCVNPPLLAKPSRGYGWTCAPCSRKHEEEVDSHEVRHPTPIAPKPKTNAPAPRGRGRPRKDRTLAEKEENMEIKHFKMWPFRYFGLYTVAEDTLDPDDLIFPRTATRVGPKYQSSVPLAPGLERSPELEERGGDSTIEVLGLVQDMSPAEVDTFELCKNTLTKDKTLKANVDWLTEVTFRFTDAWLAKRDLTTVNMKSPMRLEKWKKSETRYTDKDWNVLEIAAFEDAMLIHGAELRPVRDQVGTRPMPEVVRFYAHWKNSKLGEENIRIRAARSGGRDDAVRFTSPALSIDEGSIVRELTRGNNSCGACRTRESDVWWKAPKGLPTNILCDNCGISWRKYADLNVRPVREEALAKAKSGDKREGTPLHGPASKRAKTTPSVTSTPPPSGPVPATTQLRCLACQKQGPAGKVLRCRQCQFRVHAGVCGVVVDQSTVESWICELCSNEKTLEASLIPDCILCPRVRRDPKKKLLYPPPDSFLRACKPTEGQTWVHVVCTVFIPEVMYSDARRLRLVEGVSTIPQYRWSNKCTLCDHDGGAVVKCAECPAEFHVSCAWRHGHKFGFELQPVKASRRDSTTIVEFKDHSGCMVPLIICKGHIGHRRELHEICETNEFGETALQIYCQNYKQVPTAHTHGLLRKARRLDNILGGSDGTSTPSSDADTPPSGPEFRCYRCRSEFSPFFHPVSPANGKAVAHPDAKSWMCHRCFVEARENQVVTNGTAST
ncbi:hypothetical protein SCP_0906250 [Sparassis crispa]|uniref:Lid2 complex component snt2 n=1 Tax=Sparassis crispa TaxID=139825 RepID=A0A401GY66_9APHY|nr:hypothetical protein SCP_0906250 [Sparassis crispa]GBE86744.1 hypothetical protein SCP_0906250 [Sparassis crispa]